MAAATLVLRRARSQAVLLAVVLVVVVAGTTLLGTCALLLTTTRDEAVHASLQDAGPADLEVLATFTAADEDPASAAADAAALVTTALAPFPSRTSTWWASPLRSLPPAPGGQRRLGYLAGGDDLTEHADLVAGRWPAAGGDRGPVEVAVPAAAAEALGLRVDDRVVLTSAPGGPPVPQERAEVVVVGTFTPRPGDAAWARDLLEGEGSSPAEDVPGARGRLELPAYGPFVLADGPPPGGPDGPDGAGVSVDTVSLATRPEVGAGAPLEPAALDRVRAAVAAADGDAEALLGTRATDVRVRSSLSATLADARTQQRATGAQVLVLALLSTLLSATTLGLAGRLVAARRAGETALLTARGAGRGQLLGQAGAEAVVLGAVAAALAVPLSLLLHRALVTSPLLARAGFEGAGAVTPALVAAVLAGGVALAAALVVPSLAAAAHLPRTRAPRGGALARSGADLLLVGVAVVAYLQLRDRSDGSGAGADPVLVVAPVLCLLAGAVLVLRVVPVVSRWGERRAGRGRGLVPALAAWDLARRPHATAAAFLLVLATATATFGAASAATWYASQQDQADAAVGTDLSVVPTGRASAAVAGALAGATGGTVVPVTWRPVQLGTRSAPEAPTLVAVDTTRAEELVRGRLPGAGSWSRATAGLAPQAPADGIAVDAGAGAVALVLSGGSPGLQAAPTLVLQDPQGARAAVLAPPVPLDGRPHPLQVPLRGTEAEAMTGGVSVVGLLLQLTEDPAAPPPGRLPSESPVTVRVQFPPTAAGAPAGAPGWTASSPAGFQVYGPEVVVERGEEGATVALDARVAVLELDSGPGVLLATAFEPPAEVPVTLSADLADELGAAPGDQVEVALAGSSVLARVAGVVPYVPSVPRSPAMLADSDALSRALLAEGSLPSTTDRWWVTGVADPVAAAARVEELGLGGASARAGLAADWRGGPLHVGVPLALAVLVAAACALALAGAALHVTAALQARAVEIARLQALGIPRRSVLGVLLAQHAALVVLATAAGALVGAALARTVAPLMVVSTTGRAPVPAAAPSWPWAQEAGLLALLAVGAVVVAVPVAATAVRRAGAAHLRLDAGS